MLKLIDKKNNLYDYPINFHRIKGIFHNNTKSKILNMK